MIRKKQIESLAFFVLVTALPVIKVALLGEFDSEEQRKYIRVYFWIQFLIPIIDFGYYWTAVRLQVVDSVGVEKYRAFSFVGILLALIAVPIDILYTQLLLLATVTAWYNFRLQIFRINGDTQAYYYMRFSKVALDAVLVCSLFLFSLLTVETLLIVELISLVFVGAGLTIKENTGVKVYFFGLGRFFSFDYLYTLLKVSRSSLVRLLIPFLFLGQGVEGILFMVLFYELVAQYLSIEKLKDLLLDNVRVVACALFYFVSLPVQYLGIDILAVIMAWDFGPLEICCVILGGSARIFSIYTLKAIKKDGFDLLVWLNVFLLFFGVIEIFSFQQFVADGAAQLALLTFYGVEALFSVSVVFWFERSKLLKSK